MNLVAIVHNAMGHTKLKIAIGFATFVGVVGVIIAALAYSHTLGQSIPDTADDLSYTPKNKTLWAVIDSGKVPTTVAGGLDDLIKITTLTVNAKGVIYNPGNASDWTAPLPTSDQTALDRLAKHQVIQSGLATLVNGNVTVYSTLVTSTSYFQATIQSDVPPLGSVSVGSILSGFSFSIQSSNDTSNENVHWLMYYH